MDRRYSSDFSSLFTLAGLRVDKQKASTLINHIYETERASLDFSSKNSLTSHRTLKVKYPLFGPSSVKNNRDKFLRSKLFSFDQPYSRAKKDSKKELGELSLKPDLLSTSVSPLIKEENLLEKKKLILQEEKKPEKNQANYFKEEFLSSIESKEEKNLGKSQQGILKKLEENSQKQGLEFKISREMPIQVSNTENNFRLLYQKESEYNKKLEEANKNLLNENEELRKIKDSFTSQAEGNTSNQLLLGMVNLKKNKESKSDESLKELQEKIKFLQNENKRLRLELKSTKEKNTKEKVLKETEKVSTPLSPESLSNSNKNEVMDILMSYQIENGKLSDTILRQADDIFEKNNEIKGLRERNMQLFKVKIDYDKTVCELSEVKEHVFFLLSRVHFLKTNIDNLIECYTSKNDPQFLDIGFSENLIQQMKVLTDLASEDINRFTLKSKFEIKDIFDNIDSQFKKSMRNYLSKITRHISFVDEKPVPREDPMKE